MPIPIELVIARYREDVSWVRDLGFPAIIYDKSGEPSPSGLPDPPLPDAKIRPLPNVGREAHTYLTHILDRWNALAKFTVFLQGDPFPHMELPPRQLRAEIRRCAERNTPFKGFAFYRIRCDALGRPHQLCEESSKGRWAGYGRDIPVGETYARLFTGDVPDSYNVRAPAGLFLVRRDRIRLRPESLYETALSLLLNDPDDAHNTGHALERLWYLIFNGHVALNRE